MRIAARILWASALILLVFAYWGSETQSGRRIFHEFDVVIPWTAGAIGLLLAPVGAGCWIYARRRPLQ